MDKRLPEPEAEPAIPFEDGAEYARVLRGLIAKQPSYYGLSYAGLVERYLKENAEFELWCSTTDPSDWEINLAAEATYERTARRMAKAKVLTREDAMAAMRLIMSDDDSCGCHAESHEAAAKVFRFLKREAGGA
jgi:hypothetical protein